MVIALSQYDNQLYKFKDVRAAAMHMLVGPGDAVCSSHYDVARTWNELNMPSLARYLEDHALAREIESFVANTTEQIKIDRYLTICAEQLWRRMKDRALYPPTDEKAAEMIREIEMAKGKKKAPEVADGDPFEASEKPAKVKKAKAPKVPGVVRTKLPVNATIHLLTNEKTGVPYSKENNPKRPGSKSHARFVYDEGMTVGEALAGGIILATDIQWDIDHKFIRLDVPAVVEEPAQEAA